MFGTWLQDEAHWHVVLSALACQHAEHDILLL
jgi:hypothetical protein